MAETTVIRLKLLIDTKARRVLFAEAGKDFMDFLIYILSLPVGAVLGLLCQHENVGSLQAVYRSIENLDESYIQPKQSKDSILNPVAPIFDSSVPLLPLTNGESTAKKFYRCPQCSNYVSNDPKAACPSCNRKMTSTLSYVAPPAAQQAAGEDGYVKGMVMDDLVYSPLSTISFVTLLNKLNVKDLSVMEEKVVNFGMDEAVELLNASLQSKKVLTDVFLK